MLLKLLGKPYAKLNGMDLGKAHTGTGLNSLTLRWRLVTDRRIHNRYRKQNGLSGI
jgi:hypothetical protein|uniref:Uncharacterized protein n=1 Tax=Picea sitchensis TaxID=3332 RepID=A0A6B9XQ04_PICSI|nr:hypothetical protein Q903MT_gene4107 [Picea sitchensis]